MPGEGRSLVACTTWLLLSVVVGGGGRWDEGGGSATVDFVCTLWGGGMLWLVKFMSIIYIRQIQKNAMTPRKKVCRGG